MTCRIIPNEISRTSESIRRKRGIPCGVLNVLVPEVCLERAGIVAVDREFVAAESYELRQSSPAASQRLWCRRLWLLRRKTPKCVLKASPQGDPEDRAVFWIF
jgi:hypothetical protein